jgi:gliding motility-associated lipoprotein GldD
MNRYLPLFALLITALLSSCEDDDGPGIPKPRGYFRISLPEKKYVAYDAECPFTFEIPDYSKMYKSAAPMAEPCWRDLYFAPYRATLYLSYKAITNDTMLAQLVNESWALTEAHHNVAMGLRDSSIIRPDAKVYGTVLSLGGNAATAVQFYLTDSTNHFIRGSLYFYSTPNKDSLQPVLDYLRKDIYHIAHTLKWKEGAAPETKTKVTGLVPTFPRDEDIKPPPLDKQENVGTKEH